MVREGRLRIVMGWNGWGGRLAPHTWVWLAAFHVAFGVVVLGTVLYLAWRFLRAYEAHGRR